MKGTTTMTLTRKHFQAVADLLSSEDNEDCCVKHYKQSLIKGFADMFVRENGNFSRQRFYTACNFNGNFVTRQSDDDHG